jgi:hypothetical protein
MNDLWERVDRLIDDLGPDRAADHGLAPLAARRLRALGQSLPERIFREERAATTANLVAPALLARAREAYDGPLLLLKGPELSRRYPGSARRFADIDLLAADAEAVQAALLAAGFRLEDREWPPADWDYLKRSHYHLHPLEWPGLALKIEVHREVKWPPGLHAPPNGELLEAAVPASAGVDGLLAPHPEHHAVLLASHAWSEVPMRRLRDIVDVMAFVNGARREDLSAVARSWGFERPWQSTLAVADWLLDDAPEPRFVGVWARYLRHLREPTVIEMHLQEWLSPFWLAPPAVAIRRAGAAVARDFKPWPEHTWRDKLRQVGRALIHPLSPKSAHDRRSGTGRWYRGKAG